MASTKSGAYQQTTARSGRTPHVATLFDVICVNEEPAGTLSWPSPLRPWPEHSERRVSRARCGHWQEEVRPRTVNRAVGLEAAEMLPAARDLRHKRAHNANQPKVSKGGARNATGRGEVSRHLHESALRKHGEVLPVAHHRQFPIEVQERGPALWKTDTSISRTRRSFRPGALKC